MALEPVDHRVRTRDSGPGTIHDLACCAAGSGDSGVRWLPRVRCPVVQELQRCANVCRVGPGGFPPRPPSDPDVRDYRIRLLGTADSQRTECALDLLSERVALRCRTGSMSPASFPHSVPLPRRPLPSSGSLRARFPGLISTMGRSDSPLPIPVGSFPRPAVPSRAPCFAPNTGKHYP